MANDLAASIQELLIEFWTPLQEAVRDPRAFGDWLATLGQTEAICGDPALLEIAQHAELVIEKLATLDAQALKSWAGLAAVLECGREAADLQRELREFAENPARAQAAAGLAEEIMSLLFASYLRRRHPTAFRIASLLTLISPRETAALDPPLTENGATIRYARILDRLKLASVSDLITRPGEALNEAYFPNEMSMGADAWLSAGRLFPNLSFLADALDLASRIEYRSTAEPLPPSTEEDPEEAFLGHLRVVDDEALPAPPPPLPDSYFAATHPTFRLTLAGAEADSDPAVEILSSSRQHAGAIPGFIVTTDGDFNYTETRGQWKLTCSASGAIPAFAMQPDGFSRVPSDHPPTTGAAKLVIERMPAEGSAGPAFLFGSVEGTRLEMGNLRLAADLSYNTEQLAASIGLDATSGALVIAPGDGDGFLSSILPAEGIRTEFDLGLAWSNTRGLTLRGGAGLDATIPIGRSIGGIALSTLYLSLQAQNDRVAAEVSASLSASIGPVRAVLDRVGIAGALSFPASGCNLGVADLGLRFKPPSGVGVSIDAKGVLTGGGFLFHDDAQQLYAGAMQLSLHDLMTLKAFGLVSTRMPDGSRGYSLLIFITAEDFRPIQLGMGFTLLGIGGMLAVNRTFDQEVLRQGLSSGMLANLLFPRDPVGNAPALVQALASAFPARRGSYLLGILAKIGWLTPAVVVMDLALILEFGARQRLLALGRISSLLPTRENDLVRLNLDAMGVLDFDEGSAAIDAVLVDSRLARRYVLTGAAALRARWSSGPGSGFVLAVGGLNPHFAPPAGLPSLPRIAIALSSGKNPRLTCEAYFAITSNTVQFGARAQLYAEAFGFSVQGDVGFDVLLQIVPLHFIADYHVSVQLKRGSHNLFKVALQGELEGPMPLRVSGKASFEILCCDFSVRFDKTLVGGQAPPLPQAVDVFAELARALSAAQSWSTQLEGEGAHGVALRRLAPGQPLVLDPLGRITVKQQVVPLNTGRDVDTFAGAPVAGPRRFNLSATLNPQEQAGGAVHEGGEAVLERFAPAQFFAMSDDEKLSAPSFVEMEAGLMFGSALVSFDEREIVAAPVEYASVVVAAPSQPSAAFAATTAPLRYVLPANQLQAQTGAVARAPVRRVGRARFRNTAAVPAARLRASRWSIVPLTEGAPATVDPSVRTWSDYQAALTALNRSSARWQIVPAHEIEA